MSLAIVDAVAEPLRAPSVDATSPYLASIANVPLIGHVFDELAVGGVRRALIVARADARRELEAVLEGGRSWGVEVSYSDAPEADGEEAVLTHTRRALSSGPVLVYPADSLFPGQVAAMRNRFSQGDVDCVLLAPGSGSSSPRSRMFTTAVMLGPGTETILGETLAQRRDPEGLAQKLLTSDCRVAVCPAAKQWHYSDSTERLLAANRMVLDELAVAELDDSFHEHNEIHGRVSIGHGARISNSTVIGPVAIDREATIEDSYVGPYTAIGRAAAVSGSELDNTMVLPFAELRHPGMRIEASIIGEGTSVSRSFELPKGLHLRLTPGSQVIVS